MARFSRDDVINAEIDDKAREHHTVVQSLHEAFARRKKGNDALRRSLTLAKERTTSFADFERMVIHREERH